MHPFPLVFRPLNEVLEALVPADVADLFTDSMNPSSSPNYDGGLTFYKGIVAGALLSLGAKDIHYVCSDDADKEFLDDDLTQELWDSMDPDHPTYQGLTLDHEVEPTYPQIIAAHYYGFAKDIIRQDLNLEWPSTQWEGIKNTYDVSIQYEPFAFFWAEDDNLYNWDRKPKRLTILITRIQAEGGPPSDIFIFETPEDR